MKKLFDEIPYMENERVILRRIIDDDAAAIENMVKNDIIYHYEPTYLFERQYTDVHEMIRNLYGECFLTKQNLILGIFLKENAELCGLAEFYDYIEKLHVVSIGIRLRKKYWGKGIATDATRLMSEYLFTETDIEIITASTMSDNKKSQHVLEKTGFIKTQSGKPEDWGYDDPILADKWFL